MSHPESFPRSSHLSRRTNRTALARYCLLSLLALVLTRGSFAAASPTSMPQPALLPHYSPLCDSNLVGCLDIDDFGMHAYGHLLLLPRTDQRSTAAVFPYGVTVGLFGRFAGGVATDFSIWQIDGREAHQHGPLRLNLTALVWPLLPFHQAPQGTQEEDGATHHRPARYLRIGLHYEHQLRLGPFDGVNALGVLADLAALRVVISRVFGPVELIASLGALYDWRGAFATSEAALQVGVYLPFFRALKIYGEALGRGWPAYVKRGEDGVTPFLAALISPDGVDPIRRQGVLGVGLSYRPQARVDLGVSVQMGLGGLAPSAVLVRVLVLSVGKTYQGRTATPVAQLAADVTVELATWAKEWFAAIDPYLTHGCILYDDKHQPVMSLGELGPDGESCIYKGLRVPIGPHFEWNKARTRLCHDKELLDCFLLRPNQQAPWEPVHPLLVHKDCFAYWQGRPWMRVGQPSSDGQTCENAGHVIPVGQALKQDPDHDSYYCYDEPNKAKHQTKKLWCLEKPDKPKTDGEYAHRRWAQGIDNTIASLTRKDEAVRQGIDEMAAGAPLHATTPYREAEASAKQLIDRVKTATPEDAKRIAKQTLSAAIDWFKKPRHEQLGDVAEGTGEAMASPMTYAPGVGAVFNRGGRLAVSAADKVEDAAKAAKKAEKAAGASHHLREAAEAAQDGAGHSAPAHIGVRTTTAHSPDGAGEHLRHAPNFDKARAEAFERAGMTDPSQIKFSKVDPKTGTVVEFKGPNGAKVAYDSPHASPGPGHDKPHVGWQIGGKRGGDGTKRGNITYDGPQHPHRSNDKGVGNIDE